MCLTKTKTQTARFWTVKSCISHFLRALRELKTKHLPPNLLFRYLKQNFTVGAARICHFAKFEKRKEKVCITDSPFIYSSCTVHLPSRPCNTLRACAQHKRFSRMCCLLSSSCFCLPLEKGEWVQHYPGDREKVWDR